MKIILLFLLICLACWLVFMLGAIIHERMLLSKDAKRSAKISKK